MSSRGTMQAPRSLAPEARVCVRACGTHSQALSQATPWDTALPSPHSYLLKMRASKVGKGSPPSSPWHRISWDNGTAPRGSPSSGASGYSCQLENRRAVGGQHLVNKFTHRNNGFHVDFS